MPALNPAKKSKSTRDKSNLPKMAAKKLSPHKTSLRDKLTAKKSKSTRDKSNLPKMSAKKLIPQPHLPEMPAKKTKSTRSKKEKGR